MLSSAEREVEQNRVPDLAGLRVSGPHRCETGLVRFPSCGYCGMSTGKWCE